MALARRERLEPAGGGLAPPLAAEFEAWLETSRARYLPPLSLRELHAGARALSTLYVEGRGAGRVAARATEGVGKRAAFASYYAPLHFLAVHHALAALPGRLDGVRRILDLGCGTGAAGAAVARALAGNATLWGLDRSGWALGEARRTHAAFGLRGRVRRGRLPVAFPRAGAGDLLVLGWVVNELPDEDRERLRQDIDGALARGAGLLLFEPLAGSAAPWWPAWSAALAARGVRDAELRVRPALPRLLVETDRAIGLRHDEIGARLLHGPAPGG
ncbi:MAG: methyltransferase domain-containing protein, partial [Myxococcota bacterium]|nr:methyltransferase domain-containing protein [Myxococcota bacterium]